MVFFHRENRIVFLKSQISEDGQAGGSLSTVCKSECHISNWTPFLSQETVQDNVCDVPVGTKVPSGTGAPQYILMERRKAALQNKAIVLCREVWIARPWVIWQISLNFSQKVYSNVSVKNSWSMPVHIVFCLCLFKYYYWECCQFLTELLLVFKSVLLHLELCSSFSLVGRYMTFQVSLIRAHLLLEESSSDLLSSNCTRTVFSMLRKLPEIFRPRREPKYQLV